MSGPCFPSTWKAKLRTFILEQLQTLLSCFMKLLQNTKEVLKPLRSSLIVFAIAEGVLESLQFLVSELDFLFVLDQ